MERKKVETFDLSNLADKAIYEDIINRYEVVEQNFSYMKDGTPKITVWYVFDDDR